MTTENQIRRHDELIQAAVSNLYVEGGLHSNPVQFKDGDEKTQALATIDRIRAQIEGSEPGVLNLKGLVVMAIFEDEKEGQPIIDTRNIFAGIAPFIAGASIQLASVAHPAIQECARSGLAHIINSLRPTEENIH